MNTVTQHTQMRMPMEANATGFHKSVYSGLGMGSFSPSQWPRGLRHGSAPDHFLGLRVRIPPEAWISVSFECCVLSCRGIRVRLITRPEEFYRVPCV
jgi:hypothetical protein